jgi:hypothetical protein
MIHPIVTIDLREWSLTSPVAAHVSDAEAARVLYFPSLAFELSTAEKTLLRPDLQDPARRNISQVPGLRVAGAVGSTQDIDMLDAMLLRFRSQATQLVESLFPAYRGHLQTQPTSFRPSEVATRTQSWRADDKRLHVDAFPSRPNYGARILRVFSNLNPDGKPRVWRVGEPFEAMAAHFKPRVKPYSAFQAALLDKLGVTKSRRSEYDHIMKKLHDLMKQDADYQRTADQIEFPFAAGSTWICFSDQTLHAVLSGQFMVEQTWFMEPRYQYEPERSPLAITSKLWGRPLTRATSNLSDDSQQARPV